MSAFWAFSDAPIAPGELRLSGDEARHLTARRMRSGDALSVFDGRGTVASARLDHAGRREAVVVVESVETWPAPAATPVLASAIPKGDRLSTMLQMLSQLGASIWQPLVLEHSVVRDLDPDAARLRRILVESAKLARRPWLLEVRAPIGIDAALAQAAPEATRFGDRDGAVAPLDASVELVLIGPEAGFSEPERRLLDQKGVCRAAFAAHNLRIETAAIAAAVSAFAGRGEAMGDRA